jgi:hypothetical protein
MNWLDYLSSFSILFPLAAALYGFRRLNFEMKLLGYFFILSAFVDVTLLITASFHANNLWLLNIFMLIEAAVYLFICARWLHSEKLFRSVMVLFVLYFLFWIYTTFVSGSFTEFNDKEKTLKGILLVLISGYLLIRISQEETIYLTRDYRFWVLSGILLYFLIGVIVFTTANYVLENHVKAMYYSWSIHSVINIISNLLFAYGFLCYYRKMSLSI